jgi:alpha/beta superfamily hydrolase
MVALETSLTLPKEAMIIVLFVHGSGSSRHSPRNQFVAHVLIVGGHDDAVLELNMQAQQQMRCEVKLEIVPEATHLFEEPGALDRVAQLASDWFRHHAAE